MGCLLSASIAILFGSETGNAESCAYDLARSLEEIGRDAEVFDLETYDRDQIQALELLVIISSTFGNGEPPTNAEAFMAWLRDDRPDMSGVRFAVCGLGDTIYENFAQCGKDFDRLLGELGGERAVDRADCDTDLELPFGRFVDSVVSYVDGTPAAPKAEVFTPPSVGFFGKLKGLFGGGKKAPKPQVISRRHPAKGKLVDATRLTGPDSTRETRHYVVEIGLLEPPLVPGDSIGILAQNEASEVAAVIAAAGIPGEATVSWNGAMCSLRQVLTEHASLRLVTRRLLGAFAEGPGPQALAQGEEAFAAYIADRHVVDVLSEHEGQLKAAVLVRALRPLAPRLYSVANAPAVDEKTVHLCVETVRYELRGRQIGGVASSWLADRCSEGAPIKWFPQRNAHFHLPSGDSPLILIGPGTGIAPFRGFLQQLAQQGGGRDTWLFFGRPHAATDDLYGDEREAWLADGTLTKASLAWSRDQDHKVYVQHLIAEQADELWAWWERGATIMVCGDASGMALGVRAAFEAIAAERGHGEGWLEAAMAEDRYREDVY